MKRLARTFRWIYFSLLIFSFFGCAEWNYRKLESAELVTGTELRQNWNDYIVYYRPNAGILYKIKNNRNIELPGKWVKVASEDKVTDNTIFYLTDVRKILDNIEKTGSINQTAKMMKMSYKAVWSKIKATEKHLDTLIVHTDRKEGSRLSKEGKELLEKYRLLKK